jgi:hypothetical protein
MLRFERMLTVARAVTAQRPCQWDCHRTLTAAERALAIEAIYTCDDALRGWGYTPIYDIHGDLLWREAQRRDDASYRGVAVRFGECIFRRLVGGIIHEVLHASFGDTSKANYGMPFGLPYGVPRDVPEQDEDAYLAPFNFCEARAFVGVWTLGQKRFGVTWDVRTARDVGTYCFRGGNALVPVPSGYRPVAHIDPVHHAERYMARARKLEDEARAWFTDANLAALIDGIDAAAARGKATRRERYPEPAEVAAIRPSKIGRNDPCPCGSAKKVKSCCGDRAGASSLAPSFSR